MEFTGERFIPTLSGDIRLEHFHRYEWCLPFVAGKRVLDIACGEGYGSRILGRTAQSVIGVDISPEAVEHAKAAYHSQPSLSFKQGDAAEIPLPDQCVDVVVSFETIEHHDRHTEMLSEIRRVLAPNGLLILSSPNKSIYSDLAGGNHNHFHVKELYFTELDELLKQYFSSVAYLGQRVTATSLLQPLQGDASKTLKAYTETTGGVKEAAPAAIEPMYYLALASNAALPDLPQASAFLSETDNAFYEKQREVLQLETEVRRMSDYIAEVTEVVRLRDSNLASSDARILEMQAYIVELEARLVARQAELSTCQAKLDATIDSRARRLLQKIRAALTKN